MNQAGLAPLSSATVTQLSREELAAVAATYVSESAKYNKWEIGGVLGGLSLAVLLMSAAPTMGLAHRWDSVFFFGGWGIALAVMFVGRRRRRAALTGLQIECANCGTPFMDAPRFLLPNRIKVAQARADIIIATGSCPSCGQEFIAR
jgi:hypothetical protein